MSILQQVIEEYGISETCRGLTDKTDKRASVSSVSDWSTDSDISDVMPHEERVAQELLEIMAMRERGEMPRHYTATTTCKHCGPVPIWEGCSPEVLGCPWCFNRHKGLPIPRNRE
jgi:hypothetical protein